MMELIVGLIVLNLVSAALAAYFWRKTKLIKQRPESIELQEFLLDLMAGGSLIHVTRIAPQDVLIRSRSR